MNRPRVDDLLVERGLCETRDEAVRAVMAGRVRSADVIITNAGMCVDPIAPLTLRPLKRFVSRGGEKLEKALQEFSLEPSGLCCIDVGASTGGFTDCLLQHDAKEVCAVDVGYGQFAWELRSDPRVRLFERTNIATADLTELGAPFDLVVIDVSFTRVGRLVSTLDALVSGHGHMIALVKPQFELPKSLCNNGVIVEQELHAQALELVLTCLSKTSLVPQGLTFSPIKGPKGNIEFLLWAQKKGNPATIFISEVVRAAHAQLNMIGA